MTSCVTIWRPTLRKEKGIDDSTALTGAALNGNPGRVAARIAAGAGVNLRSLNGRIIALEAAKGHADVVAVLRAAGAGEWSSDMIHGPKECIAELVACHLFPQRILSVT